MQAIRKTTLHHLPKQNNEENAFAKYTGLGVKMLLIIGAFSYAGTVIDDKYPNKYSLGTLILSLLGVGLALFTSLRGILKDNK